MKSSSRQANRESAEQLRNTVMALDRYLNDDGYQEVNSNDRSITDRYAPDEESDDEANYEYGNGRGRRRRNQIPEYPFQSTPVSLNKTWLCVLACLAFFALGYYQIGKIEKRKARIKVLAAENEKLKSSIANETAAVSSQSSAKPITNANSGGDSQNHNGVATPNREIPQSFDPFNLHSTRQYTNQLNEWTGAPFILSPPKLPVIDTNAMNGDGSATDSYGRLGYFQYPTILNKTIVFSSEGDLYLTRLNDDINSKDIMPAMKLTTTIGNAIHPKLNPKYPHLLAYSATYTGVREVYLMDLRGVAGVSHMVTGAPGTPGGPALRLTYTPGGIISVVGWDEEGMSILYSAHSMDANALPDIRLFRLWLSSGSLDEVQGSVGSSEKKKSTSDDEAMLSKKTKGVNNNDGKHADSTTEEQNQSKDESDREHRRKERIKRHLDKITTLSDQARRNSLGSSKTSIRPIIEPVPLAQATEGVYHTIESALQCMYFTRFKQSSNTKRYVGGTAESIWAYCPQLNDDLAIPLTGNYNGTSKSPSVYKWDEHEVLLFMSDRSAVGNGDNLEWTPSTMNLWAMKLPITTLDDVSQPIKITNVACINNGIDLSEYVIDPEGGAVILRIGADLQMIPKEEVYMRLSPLLDQTEKQQPPKWNDYNQPLPVAVYSDFSNMQKRTIPFSSPDQFDVFTSYDSISVLVTGRGQAFVVPVIPDTKLIPQSNYGGSGRNMPERRYKVAPGIGGEGLTRILCARHVPRPDDTSDSRLALVLATDPLSPTGEHAFYLIRVDHKASPSFGFASLFKGDNMVEGTGMPSPILGGHLSTGGSTKQGGLGSVYPESVTVSPCGRRAVWTDTDGRIVAITIPKVGGNQTADVVVFPQENDMAQPVRGEDAEFAWSPGGRYLAIQHTARNQFSIISIADLGSPEDGSIQLSRIVQSTPDRFNSFSPVFGKTQRDFVAEEFAKQLNASSTMSGATTLFFLSDRDVKLAEPSSPWGTRSPQPNFRGNSAIFALPLSKMIDSGEHNVVDLILNAAYAGGGASEISMSRIKELELLIEATKSETALKESTSIENASSAFVVEDLIDFGDSDEDLSFARKAYRIGNIPSAKYKRIICQLSDDPSMIVVNQDSEGEYLQFLATSDYPSDGVEAVRVPVESKDSVEFAGTSTNGDYVVFVMAGKSKIIPNTAAGIEGFMKDTEMSQNIAHLEGLHIDIWPALEYQQMYKDAWRQLRDYFWDSALTGLQWDAIFDRYLPLVERCSKREELDDVLRQMASELNALHVFVYDGDYSLPNHGDSALDDINAIASLGAVLRRSIEMNGYTVISIPERDPDFQSLDEVPMYSPLSSRTLLLSGQVGLLPGDVIVGVNGEHVMNVPDIHSLMQNKAGETVRLEVVRYNSTSQYQEIRRLKNQLQVNEEVSYIGEQDVTEPLLVVPISFEKSYELFYAAWEYNSRQLARKLSADAGFTIGYIHIQDMSGASAEDAFVRGFYPDYDKQALIIDVRNNKGGNIDSWILDVLQRKAWMYWEQSRSNKESTTLWNSRFAFRGHLAVLINEHTSSDGEAFARGVSELGLGKLVGKRTWGGGIWLSSDNRLVDGGIASAPETGTFNERLGWGLGIEQVGVKPDFEVDNNPRTAFDGEDVQLKKAVSVLKDWLESEPVSFPKPVKQKNMNIPQPVDDCLA